MLWLLSAIVFLLCVVVYQLHRLHGEQTRPAVISSSSHTEVLTAPPTEMGLISPGYVAAVTEPAPKRQRRTPKAKRAARKRP